MYQEYVVWLINRILRNLADQGCGMLRVCVLFSHSRCLQTIFPLCLLLFVLSLQILRAVVEHSALEKIELGSTIHAPFTEVSPFRSSVLDERSSDALSLCLSW